MNRQLSELVVTDFRSIKGTLTIPLDAPIILIHGPNGAGKTSIATALELALTGDVAALRRSDDNVQAHLVNRDADQADVALSIAGAARPATHMTVRGGMIEGRPLLDQDEQIFYLDRCYLSQSTLGRLLDIYQAPTSRDPTNTPLTNFVKSLLGLDQLEALIDGLNPAGHKARMSKLSADFDRADQLEGRLRGEQREVDTLQRREDGEAAELEARLEPLRSLLDLPEGLDSSVAALAKSNDPQLLSRHESRVNGVVGLQLQWSSFSTDQEQEDRAALEQTEAEAAVALEQYNAGPGKRLADVITSLRPIFPDLADPTQTNPESARHAASELVAREIVRLESILVTARTASQTISVTDQRISQHRARLDVLDNQIAGIAGDSAGLGQALAALVSHMTDDICPVCSRDFAEVSHVSLRTHVSEEIAKLIGRSEQLQSLVGERQQLQIQLSEAERGRGADAARLIPQTDVTAHQQRLALLRTAQSEFSALVEAAGEGAVVRERLANAVRKLGQLRLRDSTSTEIRRNLSVLARAIGEPDLAPTETTQEVLTRLIEATEAAQKAAQTLHDNRKAAGEIIMQLQALSAGKAIRAADAARRTETLAKLAVAQRSVKRERNLATNLRNAAAEARSSIVGRVFNERLNAIWRDLFVRLAPNEPFLPAFMLPKKGDQGVSALLETLHRDGGAYGRPGAMLSAGNLNTAALTLFLALHLSVKPELPWLVLDDPVQSMDELHIAQFAALLRTLAKGEGRQVMIAIHERQLFDYLALELSPAFVGDKLITVEITKPPEGVTRYKTNVIGYEPDRLVA